MTSIEGLIHYHPALSAVIAYFIWSAFVSALPAPTANSSMLYVFFFRFFNILAANISRAFSTAVENSPNFKAAVSLLGSPITGGQLGVGGTKALLILPLLLAFCFVGCNQTAYQTATSTQKIIGGILDIIQADLPALPPADQAIVQPWLADGQTFNTQLGSCITLIGSTGKAAAFAGCFTAFASDFTSPAELAKLRILSPASQKQAMVWATAAILAVNSALTIYQVTTEPTPTIVDQPPASRHDLVAMRHELHLSPAYGF